MENQKTISGNKFKRAYTLNSQYANNYIELENNDGILFRIHVDELLKMINKSKFTFEMKRKYYHLTLIK